MPRQAPELQFNPLEGQNLAPPTSEQAPALPPGSLTRKRTDTRNKEVIIPGAGQAAAWDQLTLAQPTSGPALPF